MNWLGMFGIFYKEKKRKVCKKELTVKSDTTLYYIYKKEKKYVKPSKLAKGEL
jgi:hypothetical protein